MKRIVNTLLLPFLIFSGVSTAQISYNGPLPGSVVSGNVQNTSNFAALKAANTRWRFILHQKPEELPNPESEDKALGPENSNLLRDVNYYADGVFQNDSIHLNVNAQGFTQSNSIPPDPIIAVGPSHIMYLVNSSFRIADKNGVVINEVNADTWYGAIVSGASAFDPKVIYDHFSNRWVQVWLHQDDATSQSYFFVSVSDDDDPNGVWYNWALPSNVYGNTPNGAWGDYQGVGYDQNNIYITSNDFGFTGGYVGSRLRVVPKRDLYRTDGMTGIVTWNDFTHISYPGSGTSAFGIRPTRMFQENDKYYLAVHSPFTTGTNFGVYTFQNINGRDTLTGVAVPTNLYTSPPNADQLGGGTLLIDGGGKNLRNEPVYKDGLLHMTHSVRNGSYSAVRYLVVDVSNFTAAADLTMAESGYYYNYPALAVNSEDDVIFTYSRSSDTEYMGAYFSLIKSDGSFSGTQLLSPGNGNYVVDFGSGRNRWGDYMGAYFDHSAGKSFWIFTEYVHSTNNWGTKVAEIMLLPLPSQTLIMQASSFDYGTIEVGKESELKSFQIKNYGSPDLVVSGIEFNNPDFSLVGNYTFPMNLATYDSVEFSVKFAPTSASVRNDSLILLSNDPDYPSKKIELSAEGYVIGKALNGTFYATTHSFASGVMLNIDKTTGTGTELGASGFSYLKGLTYSNNSQELYALAEIATGSSKLIRIDAPVGRGYIQHEIPVEFEAMAFSPADSLYAVDKNKKLYTINPGTGTHNFIGELSTKIAALTFNPLDGTLWGSAAEGDKDRLFTINTSTAELTLVGKTGLGVYTRALAFDGEGNFYGVTGEVIQISKLISIDKMSAAGTVIGDIGFKGVTSMAIPTDSVTGIRNDLNSGLPANFELNNNYPNPFNPSTLISFATPVASNVNLTVYNYLGEIVDIPFDGELAAGVHRFTWNARSNGRNLSSGIYFYTLNAQGKNGSNFNQTGKMMLLK